MKKMTLRTIAMLITLITVLPLALFSCKKADTELEINVYALNGTTALGMAQMIDSAKNDTDEMNYNIELFSADNVDKVTSSVVSGECAIAALPTNAAARLYKKSEGKIQLLALNTLGVLYLLDNTGTVDSLDDLKGKTVYLPGGGSNPEYITAALIKGAGIDVTLDTSYKGADALATALIAGEVEYAVLPEPKVSVVTTQKKNVNVAIDLTEEWEKLYGENTLVQGCLVVNTEFANEHPEETKKFLQDYLRSVNFIAEGSDDAINMIVDAGILPKAAIAKKALPKCNICCMTGNEMKDAISVFYEKLYASDKTSIGALPNDGFYYIAK